MPPFRRPSSSPTGSTIRDGCVALEDLLTYFEENIHVTCWRVLANHCRPGQGLYLFETSTETNMMEIATTESIPPMMARRDCPGPIYHPAANDTPFKRHRMTVGTFFPHKRCNNATVARHRYATPIPSQAGPSCAHRQAIFVDDSDDDSVIIVEDMDDEDDNNRTPVSIAFIPRQAAAAMDGHDEEDDDEAAVNEALADLDAAVDVVLANFDAADENAA